MVAFHQATTTADREAVQGLFTEYLHLVNARVSEKLGIGFDVQAKVAEDMAEMDMFTPPRGRLILASIDSEVAGLGGLRTLGQGVAEVKRMYVRPAFRGRGVGRGLLSQLTEQARMMGMSRIRLDTAWFMEVAHSLYRSSGFTEVDPYPGSEVPKEIHHLWIFMEKDLEAGS